VNFAEPRKKKDPGHKKAVSEVPQSRIDKSCVLPAVAAVATVAAISAAPAASASSAAIPAASAPASTAVAATSSAATAALGLRTRFVDHQVPAAEILTIEIGNRAIRVFIAGDLDERKTPRLARKPVANQIDCRRGDAHLSQPFLQLFFSCGKGEITDVKLLHLRTPSARNLTAIAERTEIPVPPEGQTEGNAAGRG
jgi:hypothetical protein